MRITIACNGGRVVRFLVCLQVFRPSPLMRTVIRLKCAYEYRHSLLDTRSIADGHRGVYLYRLAFSRPLCISLDRVLRLDIICVSIHTSVTKLALVFSARRLLGIRGNELDDSYLESPERLDDAGCCTRRWRGSWPILWYCSRYLRHNRHSLLPRRVYTCRNSQ